MFRMRQFCYASSRPANKASSLTLEGKSVRTPLAPLTPSLRAHNQYEARNRRTQYIIERWSPRAVLSLMPAGEAPWRAPGRHLWLSDASVGGPFAAPARDNAPPVRMSVAHSNVLGYRTSLARGGQHRRKLALRGNSTMRR